MTTIFSNISCKLFQVVPLDGQLRPKQFGLYDNIMFKKIGYI
jgi:hypothetical protein